MPDTPRSEHLPAGYDEESPYEGVDLSDYPDWWKKNIEEFQMHELRPYRPPRFTDGAYSPPVIQDLEAELDIEVTLRALNPKEGDNWQIEIDGEPVADIGKERTGEGFTRYTMTSDEFQRIIRSVVTDSD